MFSWMKKELSALRAETAELLTEVQVMTADLDSLLTELRQVIHSQDLNRREIATLEHEIIKLRNVLTPDMGEEEKKAMEKCRQADQLQREGIDNILAYDGLPRKKVGS